MTDDTYDEELDADETAALDAEDEGADQDDLEPGERERSAGVAAAPGGPPVDRAKLLAYSEALAPELEEILAEAAAAEPMVYRELLEQLTSWARAGALALKRFALDCACGTGRIAGELIREGVPVIGVDVAHGMVRRAAAKLRRPPAAMFAGAATARLPFRNGTFGAVVDVDAFHQYPDPEAVAAEWARVLAPRGTLVLSDLVERDLDEDGFLTRVEKALRPGTINVFYKPHEIGYFLEKAGFEIQQVVFYRTARGVKRLERQCCRPAGVDPAEVRARLKGAGDELRELYEINEEGMVCRVLALMARKA